MPFIPTEREPWSVVPEPCRSPEHSPPSHIVLKPGVHTWECPVCKQRTVFSVPEVTL